MNYVTLAVGEGLLLVLTVCSLAAIFPRVRTDNQPPRLWRIYADVNYKNA